VVRIPALYREPDTNHPPPIWIRGLLVLTCTGVSFAHGSNDGQKGMGLIMLILIGAAPTAYALNRAMPDNAIPGFVQSTQQAGQVFAAHANGTTVAEPDAARARVTEAIRSRQFTDPSIFAALHTMTDELIHQVQAYGAFRRVPAAATQNIRNDMYLTSEAVRLMPGHGATLSDPERTTLTGFRSKLDASTKFIPNWVKVSVAVALGLGTMVGWKRIVVTVGEKIGKTHLTYGQGASAELIAAITIAGADVYGLPVSTTHVLSSGIAGTMAANGSGLQWSTVRSIALAWVLTLPAAMIIAGVLYTVMRQLV
jgi:inorganic phosphate transporter, PiT family